MTAPQLPLTDTNVVEEPKAEPQPQAVGKLPPNLEAIIKEMELRGEKGHNVAVAAIAKLGWGKNLDERTRRALSEWGRRFNVDVATEIDILGDKIYLNANFYLRKLSELVAAGLVEYAMVDYVHHDERLGRIAHEKEPEHLTAPELEHWLARRASAARAMWHRERARIDHGIPEAATGAAVFRVKLASMDQEVSGANWCGGGTGNHKAGGKGDPVGEKEPAKTSASRAARRCMRQIVSHIPVFAKALHAAEAEAEKLGLVVAEETAKVEGQIKEAAMIGRHQLTKADGGYPGSAA